TVMPDALITACHALERVHVHWISRYTAGASLSMDLEAVEAFTDEPDLAIERLVEVIPTTFRTDWAMAIGPGDEGAEVLFGSPAAPRLGPECDGWLSLARAGNLPEVATWDSTVLAGSPGRSREGLEFFVAVGRHGGPEF